MQIKKILTDLYYKIEALTDFGRSLTFPYVLKVAEECKATDVFIDAGSGDQRYKKYFTKCAKYIACDFVSVDTKVYQQPDIVCNLESIPLPDSSADKIFCFWVFEHLREPELVLREFKRILKPGGSIYLTLPQGHNEHEIPHDYLRYTQFWFYYIKDKAQFSECTVEKMGNYFHVLAALVFVLPQNITFLYKNNYVRFTLLLPLYFICLVLAHFIKLFAFLDKRNIYTYGYFVKYKK